MKSNLKAAKNFRKALSTIVETCLEKYKHKSIWNFRNNINQAINQSKNLTKILEESQYLVKDNPNEIDEIIKEMNDWYTGVHADSHESYDSKLVSIFTEHVTAIFVNVLGQSYSMANELQAWEQKGNLSIQKAK